MSNAMIIFEDCQFQAIEQKKRGTIAYPSLRYWYTFTANKF